MNIQCLFFQFKAHRYMRLSVKLRLAVRPIITGNEVDLVVSIYVVILQPVRHLEQRPFPLGPSEHP